MDASQCLSCGASSAVPLEKELLGPTVGPGTQHHALLNSNNPPDGSKSTFILVQSVISEADARLACLDDEISKLEEKLEQLKADRASLFSFRTRNKAILSPLRRMPAEILGEIFLWTLPSVSTEIFRARFEMGASPWVLAQISSRWRAVSLSTPSLWSQIVVNCNVPHPVSAIETQIQRAQILKIHFYGSEIADPALRTQMFRLLSRHSSRWEELSLELSSAILPLLTEICNRLSSLKRLWIQWATWESQLAVESLDCFQTAPSLVDVSILSQYRFVPIAFPAHQLTRYDRDASWVEHKRILKLAPNLVEARLVFTFDGADWPDPDEIINLLHLRRLFVSEPDALDHLRLPALDDLGFLTEAHCLEDLRFLDSFLDRSACLLRKLGFIGFPDCLAITQILRKLPSVTDLVIVIREDAARGEVDGLMSSLSNFAEGVVEAPQLRSLFIACGEETSIDYNIYLDMLQSRGTSDDCRFKTAALAIEDGAKPDPIILDGLHALRKEGLDFFMMEGQEGRDEWADWEYRSTWN